MKKCCVRCGMPCGDPVCAECKPLSSVAYIKVANKKSKIIVVGGCCHTDRPTVKHHFDYRKPLEVFLMCGSCHSYEHKCINKCAGHGDTRRRSAPDTITQRSEANRLGMKPTHLSSIINGKVDAGYNLAVKLSQEIGGTVKLWKTSDRKAQLNRRIVWREHLIKLDREEAT